MLVQWSNYYWCWCIQSIIYAIKKDEIQKKRKNDTKHIGKWFVLFLPHKKLWLSFYWMFIVWFISWFEYKIYFENMLWIGSSFLSLSISDFTIIKFIELRMAFFSNNIIIKYSIWMNSNLMCTKKTMQTYWFIVF